MLRFASGQDICAAFVCKWIMNTLGRWFLTHIRLVEPSTLINWTSQFPTLGMSGVLFHFYSISNIRYYWIKRAVLNYLTYNTFSAFQHCLLVVRYEYWIMITLYWLFCQIDDFIDIWCCTVNCHHTCLYCILMDLLDFWNFQIKLSYLVLSYLILWYNYYILSLISFQLC